MSQFNAPVYDIERPSGVCAATGRELTPGEKYIAMLVELDDAELALQRAASESGKADAKALAAAALGLKRLDVCLDAWREQGRPERLFSFWKTTVPEPNQKKRMFVDDAVLMNLFTRLENTQDSQRLAFRFVLGLILIRKKFLRYDGTQRREQEGVKIEHWLVTPKLDLSKGPLGKWNDDASMTMLNPQLDDPQIQQVTEQLGEILEGEL